MLAYDGEGRSECHTSEVTFDPKRYPAPLGDCAQPTQRHSIRISGVKHSTKINRKNLSITLYVLRVRPHKVAVWSLVRYLLHSLQNLDLIE